MQSGKIYQLALDIDRSITDQPKTAPRQLRLRRLTAQERRPRRKEKNPAVAVSISSLFWGGGQLYADSFVAGMTFLMMQALLVVGYFLGWYHGREIIAGLETRGLNGQGIFLVSGVVLAAAFASLWTANIFQAYRIADGERRSKFRGVDSLLTILFGGGWIPGMGQLFNGQPKKAFGFLISTVILIFFLGSTIWAAIAWPLLTDDSLLSFSEFLFLGLGTMSLITLAVAVFSFYDAVQIVQYPEKRESWWRRFRFAWNRWRKGFHIPGKKSFGQICKRDCIFVLTLVLALHAGWQFFPRAFYGKSLAKVGERLQQERLVVVPELLSDVSNRILRLPKPLETYAQLRR